MLFPKFNIFAYWFFFTLCFISKLLNKFGGLALKLGFKIAAVEVVTNST